MKTRPFDDDPSWDLARSPLKPAVVLLPQSAGAADGRRLLRAQLDDRTPMTVAACSPRPSPAQLEAGGRRAKAPPALRAEAGQVELETRSGGEAELRAYGAVLRLGRTPMLRAAARVRDAFERATPSCGRWTSPATRRAGPPFAPSRPNGSPTPAGPCRRQELGRRDLRIGRRPRGEPLTVVIPDAEGLGSAAGDARSAGTAGAPYIDPAMCAASPAAHSRARSPASGWQAR